MMPRPSTWKLTSAITAPGKPSQFRAGSPVDVVSVFAAAGVLLAAIQRMPAVAVQLANAEVVVERTAEVAHVPEEEGRDRPRRPLASAGCIQLEQVSFAYRSGRQVLDGVDLHIEAGETVAVVGASGSGKTSITRLLTALRQPTAGVVRLDGVSYAHLSPQQVRDEVTAVFQDSRLLQRTLRDNLTMGHPHSDEAIWEVLERTRAAEIVRAGRLGLDARASRAGSGLSAGQLQRLALARALLRDPAVLVLDEATANLDAHTEQSILDETLRLREGRTTIIIAHRLTAIERAPRVLVLAGGHIVEDGSHASLLASGGEYARLFRAQYIAVPDAPMGA